jgi:hypothetical protein
MENTQSRKQLELAKTVEVPVKDIHGNVIRYELIAGPVAYSKNPYFIEGFFSEIATQSLISMKKEIVAALAAAGIDRMFPAHPDWFGSFDGSFRILTADDAPHYTAESEGNSRSQLYYHVKPGKSLELGEHNAKICRSGLIATHDGVIYFKQGVLDVEGTLWKAIGYEDMENQIHIPKLIAKGIIRIIPDKLFNRLAKYYRAGNDVVALIPEATCKFLKDNHEELPMRWVSIFKCEDRYFANLSLKMLKTMPLTVEGVKYGKQVFGGYLKEVFDAFASNDRSRLLGLFLALTSEEDDEDSKQDLQEYSALEVTLRALPMLNAEIMGKVLPIVLRKALKRRVEGMTGTALPGFNLKEKEIRVTKRFLRETGKKIGDSVTLTRPPWTGIEVAVVVIVGICAEGIEINPTFWAERFSGDFDGDLAHILAVTGIVNEDAIGSAVSSKTKGKRMYTVAGATAKAWFSKALVPIADSLLIACLEAGIDPTAAREIMQAAVDMIKHEVELPADTVEGIIYSILKRKTVDNPAIHRILNNYRKSERLRQSSYNCDVDIMAKEGSNVAIMNSLIPYFPFIFCETKYILANDNGYVHPAHKDYIRICKENGFPEFAKPGSTYAPTFNPTIVAKRKQWAVKRVNELRNSFPDGRAVKTADQIYAVYGEMVKCFQKGTPSKAYEILDVLNAKIAKSDPDLVGNAIKYLFLCIIHRKDGIHRTGKGYGWYLKIISYLPTRIGSWDIEVASKFYGGVPAMNLVVKYPETKNPNPRPEKSQNKSADVIDRCISEIQKYDGSYVVRILKDSVLMNKVSDGNLVRVGSAAKITPKISQMKLIRAWEILKAELPSDGTLPICFIVYNKADMGEMTDAKPGVAGAIRKFKKEIAERGNVRFLKL